jgi:putative transcriptional regulator
LNFISISRGQADAVDALLASYAVGALSKPLHALVASHLALKADNRGFVSSMEHVIGGDMDSLPGGEVLRRDSRLVAIFNSDAPAHDSDWREPGSEFLPRPLADYIGSPYESLPWRSVMPGLKEIAFDHAPGCEASMLWIKAGRAMPQHTHAGQEATLVLKGSFADDTGHYGRGDISVVDSEVKHKPVAGTDEDCICFAVSEGPVRLTGPVARLFQRLLGH